ncbi:MAG: hypothetical protein KC635_19845 [Myxococcales bacterium]|nr:hypothetical protein [Myxococcales bacterium]MCB9731461.1 hypothetical protein [Deltaproteobacteria bacterium]
MNRPNTGSRTTLLTRALALALLTGALGACATATIGTTDIPDTEENRAIYDRVMEYRRAMEARDSDAVEAMVSRRYLENGATTDRSDDDYGYDTVRDVLIPELRDNVLEVQLRILPHRIQVDGDEAYADYEYYYAFKYVEGGVEGWKPKNDFNRLEFHKEDGVWKITGGL